MERAQLDAILRKTLDKGFDDSFAEFCADTFSAHNYTPGNVTPAQMHGFYLRLVLSSLTASPRPCQVVELLNGLLEENVDTIMARYGLEPSEPSEVAMALGACCYHKTLLEEGDFCRRFITSWCEYWAV